MNPDAAPQPVSPYEKVRARMVKEFGCEITGPFYNAVPFPKSEYKNFLNKEDKEFGEIFTDQIRILSRFLTDTVIIRDNFNDDHDARRKFEADHPDIWNFQSEYSKLGINCIQSSITAMDNVIKLFSMSGSPKVDELKSIFDAGVLVDEFYKKYKTKENIEGKFEDKITFVRHLDDIIYRFLEALSH